MLENSIAHPLLLVGLSVCLSVKMYFEGTFVKMYYYVSKRTMVLTEILLLGNIYMIFPSHWKTIETTKRKEKRKKHFHILLFSTYVTLNLNSRIFTSAIEKTHTLLHRIELCCAKPQFV